MAKIAGGKANKEAGAKGAAKSPDVKKPALKIQGAKPKAAEVSAGSAAEKGSKRQAAAQAASQQAAPAAAAGGSEIDELFGKLKGKKKGAAEAGEAGSSGAAASAANGAAKGKEKEKPKKVEGSKDDIFGTEAAAARKRTEEGYAIYSETELGLGKSGGGTDLCPFDCDCCF